MQKKIDHTRRKLLTLPEGEAGQVLWRRIRVRAINEQVSSSDLLMAAMKEWMENHPEPRPR